MLNNKGFTLIEIMIVVGVVLILSVIAIPNMMRSKITGNETSAAAVLRATTTACNLYAMNNSDYPADISALTSVSPPYINPDVANAFAQPAVPKDGYSFTYTKGDTGYVILASPVKIGIAGVRYFCSSESAIIRYSSDNNCDPVNGPRF